MLLVDTNVLIDVLSDDPTWADWSLAQLRTQSRLHELAINPVIYAELSLAFESVEALDDAVAGMELTLAHLSRPALFLAGKAFVRYRRQGGSRHNVLADFFIGAHAAVAGYGILTRDVRRYRNYFPTVELIAPETG
ncbi:MAG: type II toxin-antitoxin system VapC family toxin [Proteobacteria bacterium]|nr:type II toxin-antitoxin system VapC family toxin [Pseudomonadota bacterium]